MSDELLCGMTCDNVLDAIDVRVEGVLQGLCAAFCEGDAYNAEWYERIPEVLTRMGGRQGKDNYFWTKSDKGHAARDLMLAFMLTLSEDEDSAR